MSPAIATYQPGCAEPVHVAIADHARLHEASASACRFDLVTSRAGFEALAADWNDLFQRAGRGTQAFQTFDWNWHWCNHYLAEGSRDTQSLAIVTGRRAGRLVMVWPLVATRIGGLRQLTWMGEPVSQYGDVLVEESPGALALLREAWRFTLRTAAPDLMWLPKVRADAAIAPLIAELGAIAAQQREAPYLDRPADAGVDPVSTRASAQTRKKRRSLNRRLAKLGAVTFAQHAGGAAARALAARTIDMKRTQLKNRGIISPALADERSAAFFADAVDGLGHSTGAGVFTLDSNGELAAAGIFIGCKDRVCFHITAFDARYEKVSVGTLLLSQAIARSFADGYRTFDLLPPADAYKARRAHAAVGVTDWALPTSLKGRAYTRLYLVFARPALKAVLAGLPKPLRRFIASRYLG